MHRLHPLLPDIMLADVQMVQPPTPLLHHKPLAPTLHHLAAISSLSPAGLPTTIGSSTWAGGPPTSCAGTSKGVVGAPLANS